MFPKLTAENLPTPEIQKFVREGKEVLLAPPGIRHGDIAGGNREVDDAGFISRSDVTEKINIFDQSDTCTIRDDPEQARIETKRIVTEITGLPTIEG